MYFGNEPQMIIVLNT